jgi:hypothetical protein
MYYLYIYYFFRPEHFVKKELSKKLQKGLMQLKIERTSALFNVESDLIWVAAVASNLVRDDQGPY